MSLRVNIFKKRRNTNAGRNGLIKDVNGVNGVPISIAPGYPDLEDQFNQMGITHIRLHDTFGPADIDNNCIPNYYDGQDQLLLNVPNNQKGRAKQLVSDFANKRSIFPFAAKGMREKNLDVAKQGANWTILENYIERILKNTPELNPNNIQRQLMFRIGRSITGGGELPENFDIYADLVGEIVTHCNEFCDKKGLPRIKYWQVWNEPDITDFWNSNKKEDYYEFYAKIANKIKSLDADAKVGGPSVGNGYNPGGEYLDGLLKYCKKNGIKLDFLSWHYYGHKTADPQNFMDIANLIEELLKKYGFDAAESICTEWNSIPFGTVNVLTKVQTAQNAAYIASSLIYMQHCKIDKAYYYRGDGSSFGLFNDSNNRYQPTSKNFCTCSAQSFYLFNKMFETPHILCHDNRFESGTSILAGEDETGNIIHILAANYKVDLNFVNSNLSAGWYYPQYYVDSNRMIEDLKGDEWAKNEWFGGVDPTTIKTDNVVNTKAKASQLFINDKDLLGRSRFYGESDGGLELTIRNIPLEEVINPNDDADPKPKKFEIHAYRISEIGNLAKMQPDEITVQTEVNGDALTIRDFGLTASTVALYTIKFL